MDIRPTQGVPDSLSDLQNYELLILSNVPATSLSFHEAGIDGVFSNDVDVALAARADFLAAVPEPSGYGLMALGLVAVGAGVRRRAAGS